MELRRIELLSENKSTQPSTGVGYAWDSLYKNFTTKANAQVDAFVMTGYAPLACSRSPLEMMPHAGAVVLTGGDKSCNQAAKANSLLFAFIFNLVLVKAAEPSATRLSSFLVPVEAIAAPNRLQ